MIDAIPPYPVAEAPTGRGKVETYPLRIIIYDIYIQIPHTNIAYLFTEQVHSDVRRGSSRAGNGCGDNGQWNRLWEALRREHVRGRARSSSCSVCVSVCVCARACVCQL